MYTKNCRICLSNDIDTTTQLLYTTKQNDVKLPTEMGQKYLESLRIELTDNKDYPNHLCYSCKLLLSVLHNFILMAQRSYNKIRENDVKARPRGPEIHPYIDSFTKVPQELKSMDCRNDVNLVDDTINDTADLIKSLTLKNTILQRWKSVKNGWGVGSSHSDNDKILPYVNNEIIEVHDEDTEAESCAKEKYKEAEMITGGHNVAISDHSDDFVILSNVKNEVIEVEDGDNVESRNRNTKLQNDSIIFNEQNKINKKKTENNGGTMQETHIKCEVREKVFDWMVKFPDRNILNTPPYGNKIFKIQSEDASNDITVDHHVDVQVKSENDVNNLENTIKHNLDVDDVIKATEHSKNDYWTVEFLDDDNVIIKKLENQLLELIDEDDSNSKDRNLENDVIMVTDEEDDIEDGRILKLNIIKTKCTEKNKRRVNFTVANTKMKGRKRDSIEGNNDRLRTCSSICYNGIGDLDFVKTFNDVTKCEQPEISVQDKGNEIKVVNINKRKYIDEFFDGLSKNKIICNPRL